MLLSNPYKESNRITRQRLMYAGLVVLIFVFFFLMCKLTSGNPSPEELEKSIKNSEKLTRLDQLCTNIPKPNDFKFISKRITGGSSKTIVTSFYDTDLSPAEISKFYLVWFNDNGWTKYYDGQISGDLWFKKGNEIIMVDHTDGYLSYVVSCGEENHY